jgi:c-di-GMP-binding flagellar brake protein YcgR
MSSPDQSQSDLRWATRVPYASLLLVVRDGEAWRTELLDISEGGCSVFPPEQCSLEVGELVQLFFLDAPGRAVAINALVARNDQRSLGFEYHEPQSVPPQQA